MGYLTNIINDARGLAPRVTAELDTAPLATPFAKVPISETPASLDDETAVEHSLPLANSIPSEARVPLPEQQALLASPGDRQAEDTLGQSMTPASLSRDSGELPDPKIPSAMTGPTIPLPTACRDLPETGGDRDAPQNDQQLAFSDNDSQQTTAVGRGLSSTPNFSLAKNENTSYLKRLLTLNTGQPQSQDAPVNGEHNAAQAPVVKNPGPAGNHEKSAVQAAVVQAAVKQGQTEITPPSEAFVQSRLEDTPDLPESALPTAVVRRDASSPTVTAPRREPRVHIGQIDIVVMAPEPPVTPRAETRSDNSDFASRHYLRGL